jgi:hypothetical protein
VVCVKCLGLGSKHVTAERTGLDNRAVHVCVAHLLHFITAHPSIFVNVYFVVDACDAVTTVRPLMDGKIITSRGWWPMVDQAIAGSENTANSEG